MLAPSVVPMIRGSAQKRDHRHKNAEILMTGLT
jgi:hypothetical protein